MLVNDVSLKFEKKFIDWKDVDINVIWFLISKGTLDLDSNFKKILDWNFGLILILVQVGFIKPLVVVICPKNLKLIQFTIGFSFIFIPHN
jgi:hypothetical protein